LKRDSLRDGGSNVCLRIEQYTARTCMEQLFALGIAIDHHRQFLHQAVFRHDPELPCWLDHETVVMESRTTIRSEG